ncbi:IS21 family transposase [Bacillus sporothermodurans]|uniref:IS21 family transposase n=2 Tax=Heyndrickxia sporothermodurans TaxID=46224 RepID=UPI00192A7C6E|nr:IS21 family transposase [Heyndrickxia sporothermodurans]MBL5794357.1 IS21 family transposase [Heyndrickxia sporothermodurans]MBL5855329.1 IS21 family transposase [Heyndrickxia sporothermodurans]
MINMAQFYNIKFLHEVEGLSQRQIAQKLGISRNTVSKYLKQNEAPTTINRQNSYIGREYSDETRRVLPIIDQWLEDDLKRWGKQKHTAARIFRRLQDEYNFKGSESNIRKVVAKRRKKLQDVFIPLDFQLGHQFQFDWGEADIILQGRTQRIYLFYMQLSASRVRFARAYLHEKQEAFLDGFVHAFEFFGGVPTEGLFDNLKTAVVKILQGRDRLEQEAFLALQAHYLFKAEFCNVRSGNEKGRIEGTVGYVRRNALVPLPEVQSLDELNDHLLKWCLKDAEQKTVPHTNEKVAQMWEKEKEYLHPLPEKKFEACRLVSCQVNKTSLITVETNQYSIPCSYVGQGVWVKIFVDRVSVVAQNQVIAEHPRSYERNQMITNLDHYLEALLKKPRAIRDAHAFQSSDIPDVFRRFHRKMREHEGASGDRKFIRLLLLHREIGMEKLTQALLEAEQAQIYRYEVVHEIIQRLSNNCLKIQDLSKEKTPVNLLDYKIQKANIAQYGQLTGGQMK